MKTINLLGEIKYRIATHESLGIEIKCILLSVEDCYDIYLYMTNYEIQQDIETKTEFESRISGLNLHLFGFKVKISKEQKRGTFYLLT